MCLNCIAASENTTPNPAAAEAFGVTLTSAGHFLERRSAMAATS
jgi:hypothetical protein